MAAAVLELKNKMAAVVGDVDPKKVVGYVAGHVAQVGSYFFPRKIEKLQEPIVRYVDEKDLQAPHNRQVPTYMPIKKAEPEPEPNVVMKVVGAVGDYFSPKEKVIPDHMRRHILIVKKKEAPKPVKEAQLAEGNQGRHGKKGKAKRLMKKMGRFICCSKIKAY